MVEYTSQRKFNQRKLKYNGNEINNATTYKYLGNQLDRNLNLDENVE